ncbi:TIGR03571 family LLM class oxidoreductase [Dyella flava]|uniref:TIGR03571 family LLM class oxidoreductase n=1 Tax=Dyella flava TaxID=1920170 RepID=A0ABS2K232_9GAMM|nr:TIGR03571 family LLM class oxidoreductase [Dyella flava]MBM7125310.1 TIGR03571 family LLM class oxidoreductase [Dyella flava]GLQ50643.1 coenzyme F420-dependent N5,N10-methylene tetrahydromethanopterin reductase [Dyella flava]
MTVFNAGYHRVFLNEGISLGIMTPIARALDAPADMQQEHALAARADRLGFAALWTRDVPLILPQGSDNEAAVLDDPFVWLSGLAAATKTIALGTAALVLPVRHPLHVAKLALSMDRLSGGRFLLGMGSGDRPAEFAAFGVDVEERGRQFREAWPIVRAALMTKAADREPLLQATAGVDVLAPPPARIPMLVVGTSRQTLQWIASHSEAWATYHREEDRQEGRINLWKAALRTASPGEYKPFVQSLQLVLLKDPDAVPEPIELGMRTGRHGLLAYLQRLASMGVRHTILNLSRGDRPMAEVIDEIGEHVLPVLNASA